MEKCIVGIAVTAAPFRHKRLLRLAGRHAVTAQRPKLADVETWKTSLVAAYGERVDSFLDEFRYQPPPFRIR